MAKLILFNKPFDVLTQFTDAKNPTPRRTLSEFGLPPRVYPAGRLDRDSEGLLLLTDNGPLQAAISNPKYKEPKTYLALVEGAPTDADLQPLRDGITLKDGPCRPAKARVIDPPALWERDPPVRYRKSVPDTWIELTITEGRNRQVRRMTAAIGFPTLRLVRWSIADWTVTGLGLGEWREIEVPAPAAKVRRPFKRKY
ncbi:pseudouridine synthase [Marivivens niveibacter]|uniref:Pseudouridine synthase n=1 Tax=Marivivens niveibacter TaxID=1930667 RepID=A0A251WWH1_9RHOB|nr:pseudouridine synthase [Marivivens niveibacter]OUD08722.1 pseudouridine synthase [Marivivens niveibacter]